MKQYYTKIKFLPLALGVAAIFLATNASAGDNDQVPGMPTGCTQHDLNIYRQCEQRSQQAQLKCMNEKRTDCANILKDNERACRNMVGDCFPPQ